MKFKISIRTKLLVILLSFILLSFSILGLTSYYQNKKLKIEYLSEEISVIELDVMRLLKAKSDFLLLEGTNEAFYSSSQSEYISRCDSLSERINEKLEAIKSNEFLCENNDVECVTELQKEVGFFERDLNYLVSLMLRRGFKDYGLEGEMRSYAHQVEEEFVGYVDKSDILMLRRHEKDFLLRNDQKYLDKFNYQIDLMQHNLNADLSMSKFLKSKISYTLFEYQKNFSELVNVISLIGQKKGEGVIGNLDQDVARIILGLNEVRSSVLTAEKTSMTALNKKFYIALGIFILLIIYLSFKLSSNMTKRLKTISRNMNNFVNSNYKETADYSDIQANDEIGELAKNMKLLENEIVIHFTHYRKKVERRTKEIITQKEKLEDHKEIIEAKNKDILDSIRYAKRIQESMLPKKKFIDQLLNDYFIFYRPKDIVSGDFYWVERTESKVFIAVSDCTGHGVPGAFMSIMGNNFLNQAINEKGLESPDLILNYINVAVSTSLGQNEIEKDVDVLIKIQDGMDIAIVAIDLEKKELLFSGAQRPLIHVSGDTMNEIRGDKFPVGDATYGVNKRFTSNVIPYKANDMIYMFSDGYSDQFGGQFNKKFKYAKLKELLFSVRDLQMEDQLKATEDSFDSWKMEADQLDDVCLFGVKL